MIAVAQTPDLLVILVGWVVLAVWATWAVRTRPRLPESMRRHRAAMTALGRGHNEREQR